MKKATKQKFALAVTLGPVLPLIVFLNWDRFKSSSLTEMLIAVAVSLVAWAWLNVLYYGLTGVSPLRFLGRSGTERTPCSK